MFMVKYYLLITLACLVGVVAIPNIAVKLILAWSGISVFLVTLAYIYDIPTIFKKSQDGKIVWWIRWAFIPFLLGVKAYNAWTRAHDPAPAINQIAPNLYVSRRLLGSDLETLENRDISCIVDVTAEFAGLESAMTDKQFDYLTIPVLDHKSPKAEALRHALNWIDTQINQDRKVIVHCALGRGRSVFVVAAYLLSQSPELTVEKALSRISAERSTARLNKHQLKALQSLKEQGELELASPAWVVANPVSGGAA